MRMSFWSHCQGLVRRIQQGRMVRRRMPRCWWLRAESLEARTLLSSTPAMVADINPGAASSNPGPFVAIGSTTYFVANDGIHGNELWKSDGIATGTSMVADIKPGSASSYASNLTNVNGTLFFTANDGTPGGGAELWKSDGTAAGTVKLAGGFGSADDLTNVNGTLFFQGLDPQGGDLWKSDGTAAGTVRINPVNTFAPTDLTNVNGTLFFEMGDYVHGEQLWKSDGTTAGTVMVKDIFTEWVPSGYYPGYLNSSYPSNLTDVNGTLFFDATDSSGRELWKSDGTAAGTVMVSSAASSPGDLININGTLFFTTFDSVNGDELWKSDGTATGTVMLKDFDPGSSYSYITDMTGVNATLFLAANDGAHGTELWKSDGTAAGTVMVKDIFPGGFTNAYGVYVPNSSDPSSLTNVNGKLFFTANDGVHGNELWQSDGTTAGTVMVADINPGSASSAPADFTNANGTWFFAANDGIHGNELWALNTTPSPSLAVSGFPTTTTAGVAGGFTVTAKNADGTTNTGYTGTVQLKSTDSQAVLPASYTFTSADAGVHTFSVTLKTAGTQSITAADTTTAGLTGTDGNITVNAAAASTMTVAGFPSTTSAGAAGSFTVTLKDPFGNIASGYTGTVHFSSSDAKALLPANYTFTAGDAGKHTFSAALKTAGTQSIAAADTLSSALMATEGGITVNAAAASQFIISAPSTVTAGAPFSLTLTVEDAFGNVVTGYAGTIHFTSSDRTATLPANYTFTAADKGVHRFVGLVLRKTGKQKITITDTLQSALTASVIENVQQSTR